MKFWLMYTGTQEDEDRLISDVKGVKLTETMSSGLGGADAPTSKVLIWTLYNHNEVYQQVDENIRWAKDVNFCKYIPMFDDEQVDKSKVWIIKPSRRNY